MTPEGKVKAKVKRALARLIPPPYSFMPVTNGMGAQGLDFFECIGGKFVAIETKAPGNKLTGRQEVTAADIRAAGGQVYEVRDDLTLATAIASICNQCGVVYGPPIKRPKRPCPT